MATKMSQNVTQNTNSVLLVSDENLTFPNTTENSHTKSWIFYEKMILVSFYTILFVVGFLGNGAITTIIMRYKKMQTPTNWFVFNLSVTDLLISCAVMPYVVIEPHISWPFGVIACKYLVTPVMKHFAGVCVLTHTMIALTSCIIVKYGREIPKKSGFILTCLIWCVSFSFLSGTLMGPLGEYHLMEKNGKLRCVLLWEYNGDKINRHLIYTLINLLLMYVIPVLFTWFLYYRIQIISSGSLRQDSQYLHDATFLSRQKKRSRTNTILMFMFMLFTMTTLPFQALMVFKHSKLVSKNVLEKYGNTILNFLLVLFYAQVIINPLVLFHMSKDYRGKFYELPIYGCLGVTKMRSISVSVKANAERIGGHFKGRILAIHKNSIARRFSAKEKLSTSQSGRKRNISSSGLVVQVVSNKTQFVAEGKMSTVVSSFSNPQKNDKTCSSNENVDTYSGSDAFRMRTSVTTPTLSLLRNDEGKWSSNESVLSTVNRHISSDKASHIRRKLSTSTSSKVNILKRNEIKCKSNESFLDKIDQLNEADVFGTNSHRDRKQLSALTSRSFVIPKKNEKKCQSNEVFSDKMNHLSNVFYELEPRSGRRLSSPTTGNVRVATKGERKCSSNERKSSSNDRKRSSNERKRSSNERKRSSNERKRSSNERKRSSNERKRSSNERKRSSNERKRSSNERKWSSNEGKWSSNEGKWSSNEGKWQSKGSILNIFKQLNNKFPGGITIRRRNMSSTDSPTVNTVKTYKQKAMSNEDILMKRDQPDSEKPSGRRVRKQPFVLSSENIINSTVHDHIIGRLNKQHIEEKWESNGNFSMRCINVEDIKHSIYMNDANIYDLLLSTTCIDDLPTIELLNLQETRNYQTCVDSTSERMRTKYKDSREDIDTLSAPDSDSDSDFISSICIDDYNLGNVNIDHIYTKETIL